LATGLSSTGSSAVGLWALRARRPIVARAYEDGGGPYQFDLAYRGGYPPRGLGASAAPPNVCER